MLLNLHKKSWVDGLSLEDYNTHCTNNEKTVKEMLELAKNYHKVCVGRIILKHIKE
jgi:26S proteasome regulatory subunit N11